MASKLLVLICVVLLNFCDGARILGVVPTPSHSHQIVFRPIWRELSLRGHEVVVLTTSPMKNSSLVNLTEIDLSFVNEIWRSPQGIDKVIKDYDDSIFTYIHSFVGLMDHIIDKELRHSEVKQLIDNPEEKFDVVILEYPNTLLSMLAKRFKCPLIGVSSLDAPLLVYHAMGSPSHPALHPESFLKFHGDLDLWERMQTLIYYFYLKFYISYTDVPKNNLLAEKHFGPNQPSLAEVSRNLSLLFVNTNPILMPVKPLIPTIIQIGGGMHIEPPQPLKPSLQNKLDSAVDGFIYFSLGTNVKSSALSNSAIEKLLASFSDLPYQVLWKFDRGAELPNKPKNVYTATWFPQQDILRHKNIKLFITQGGLQSIEEAINFEVPVLGMPQFADQPHNMNLLTAKGVAEVITDLEHLDVQQIKDVIVKVATDSSYLHNIQRLRKLILDQPMTGLEKMVWWTEYVLRHNGTKHLKSPAQDVPFYQYYFLDIIGLISGTLVLGRIIMRWYFSLL